MKIDFIDLASQQALLREEIETRIKKVLDHGQYILGPEVNELEEQLARYAQAKHCIACASGTDALLMPLLAYGVGPGDAVITTSFSFIATAEVIALSGATPLFVDIDPQTYNIDHAQIPGAIAKAEQEGLKPKGIITVDLYGLPADYHAILPIAKEHGLFVLDDAAQGFGGLYHGRKIGSLADVTATSFYPAKPLGCYGDGGAIFTDDDALAGVMRSIRVHGKGSNKYDNVRVGINGRLDTIQAAILLCKLPIFEEEIVKRQEVAGYYAELLGGSVTLPFVPDGLRSAWAQYSVLAANRADIMSTLKQSGVPTVIHYPVPLHLQPVFQRFGYRPGDLPVSERIAQEVFSLPMHPYLLREQVEMIAAHV